MSDHSARTFSSDFKRFFLRGLVILLPSVLTLWIVVKAYQFVDTAIAEPINRSVRLTMNNAARYSPAMQETFDPTTEQLNAAITERAVERRIVNRDQVRRQLMREQGPGEPPPSDEQINTAIAARHDVLQAVNIEGIRTTLRQNKIDEWWAERWYMNLIGLIIAIIAVYTSGRLLGGFVGRRIYARLEGFLTSIPIFKQVYPYIKQIVDFLFSEEQPMKFNRVVAVEYPRRGIWSVGFMTGPTLRSIADRSGATVTVFIPSSPTPFTGYTITVPAEEVVELPITVEEAIRFAVSGGVLIPEHQSLATVPPLATDRPDGAAPLPSPAVVDGRTPAPQAAGAEPSPPTRAGSQSKTGGRRRSQRQVKPKT